MTGRDDDRDDDPTRKHSPELLARARVGRPQKSVKRAPLDPLMHEDPTGEWLFPEKEEDTISKLREIPSLTGKPASLLQRLGAWGVDVMVIGVAAQLIARNEEVGRLLGNPPQIYVVVGTMAVVGVAYELLGSLLWGRSVGRLLFGAQLVDINGEPPGVARSLLRAILSVGSWCGGFLLALVGQGQMLHEKLTSTWVVRAGTSGLR